MQKCTVLEAKGLKLLIYAHVLATYVRKLDLRKFFIIGTIRKSRNFKPPKIYTITVCMHVPTMGMVKVWLSI